MKFLVPLLLVLALVGVGCSTTKQDTVTEADRQVFDQGDKAAEILEAKITALLTDPMSIQAWRDVRALIKRALANYGLPKERKEYTHENFVAADTASSQSHAPTGGLWGWMLGAGAIVGPILWTLAQRALTGQFPWLAGVVGRANDGTTKEIIEQRAIAESKGAQIIPIPNLIAGLVQEHAQDPAVAAFMERSVAAMKKRLGVDLKIGRNGPNPSPPAVPPPA